MMDIASALKQLYESTNGLSDDDLERHFNSITAETLDKYNSMFDWLYDHGMMVAEEHVDRIHGKV